MSGNPFVTHGMAYWLAGWHGVLRLPYGHKEAPPRGETGPGAAYLTKAGLAGLLALHEGAPVDGCLPLKPGKDGKPRSVACGGRHNIGLRLPDDVIALDVDGYKGAANTLRELEAKLGPLPRTWRNSARWLAGDKVSGHLFYRVPAGRTWKGEAGRGIDVLQSGHRYAVVWPSLHPEERFGRYVLIDPYDEVTETLPRVDELPWLGEAWIAHLATRDRVKAREMSVREMTDWEAACRPLGGRALPCDPVKATLAKYRRRLTDSGRSRHDTAMLAVRALVGFAGEGHLGALEAVDEFEESFVAAATSGQSARTPEAALDEYTRLRDGAVRVAAVKNPSPAPECDCPVFERADVWRGAGATPDAGAGPGGGAPTGTPVDPAEPTGAASKILPAPEVAPAFEVGAGRAGDGAPIAAVNPTDSVGITGVLVDDLPPIEVRQKPAWAYGATQDGMAQAFVAYFGDRVRYVPDGRVSWYTWDGKLWRYDVAEEYREHLKVLMRTLPTKTPAKPDETEEEKKARLEADRTWASFRRSCLSAAGIAAITRLAQSDRRVVTRSSELDSSDRTLNTPAGVVDLATGELGPHDPKLMHTRITTVAPDKDGERQRWEEFLDQTFPVVDDDGSIVPGGGRDREMTGFMQRLIGATATGLSHAQVVPFLTGSGGNGKGVILDAVGLVLGFDDVTGYAVSVRNDFLMVRTVPVHRTEIASLMGKRMVITSETNQDDRFDEAKVKALTGEKTVRANFMRENEFSFVPKYTMWLQGNEEPEVRTGGKSLERRMLVIPFVNEVPREKAEEGLPDRLATECGPALLQWIIDGAVAYLRDGLGKIPAAVTKATARYLHDQDHLRRFLEEQCQRATSEAGEAVLKVPASELFEAYRTWCKAANIAADRVLNDVHFGRRLKTNHKIKSGRPGGRTHYLGITLRSASADEDGDDGAGEA
jgi:P4 family phage/plasmid primase-like protien